MYAWLEKASISGEFNSQRFLNPHHGHTFLGVNHHVAHTCPQAFVSGQSAIRSVCMHRCSLELQDRLLLWVFRLPRILHYSWPREVVWALLGDGIAVVMQLERESGGESGHVSEPSRWLTFVSDLEAVWCCPAFAPSQRSRERRLSKKFEVSCYRQPE
jgi:hypothetical protein